jgi:hypothetical protein
MIEIAERINRILEEIAQVTDMLYQQKLNEGYEKLNGTLTNLINVTEKIFEYKQHNSITFDENKFIGGLSQAMNAMELKDSVLLADILLFEIAKQLKDMLAQI